MTKINANLTDTDISELKVALLSDVLLSKDTAKEAGVKHPAGIPCADNLAHKLLNTSLKSIENEFDKKMISAMKDPLKSVTVYLPKGDSVNIRDFSNTRSVFNE